MIAITLTNNNHTQFQRRSTRDFEMPTKIKFSERMLAHELQSQASQENRLGTINENMGGKTKKNDYFFFTSTEKQMHRFYA